MKCIKCDTDNILIYRTANSGRCTSCNHPFVFEPTTMTGVKVTDPRFKKAIDDLSANNTLFFTQTQLAYFLDSRLRRSNSLSLMGIGCGYIFMNFWCAGFFGGFASIFLRGIMLSMSIPTPPGFFGLFANLVFQFLTLLYLYTQSKSKKTDDRSRRENVKSLKLIGKLVLVIGGLLTLYFIPSFLLFSVVIVMGIGSIYLGNRQLSLPPINQQFLFSKQEFQSWVQRWQTINQSVPKLLESPIEQLPMAAVDPDVSAYSFDRLIVCDRSDIAQLLITNNFHFENNCAVLSITGYPKNIFVTTMQMLYRNPNLKVYVVHDCSPKGMGLVQQLQSSDRWFKGRNVIMIDIGLTPRQVLSAKGIFIQTSTESAMEAKQVNPSQWQGLAQDEINWLETGNYVELESFTPQRLIQVINRGIAGSRDLSYDDGYSGGVGFIASSDSFG